MAMLIIILMLIIGIMQYRSKWLALKEIKYDYTLSKKFIEIDEPIELVSTITNESYRFVTAIRMVEVMPNSARPFTMRVYTQEDSLGTDYVRYNSSVYLTARSEYKRKIKLNFHHRGRYVFRGAELSSGSDLLGYKEKLHFNRLREVIVLPKAIESPQFKTIMSDFLGDISVQRFIVEDPILTIGVREYTGREPLKQMSWTHTARMNQMMVRQFDYTTEMIVTVFLDVSAVRKKTLTKAQFENCYSLARGVCQYFQRHKISFEFITNITVYGRNERDMDRLGNSQLSLIVEKLGRAGYGTRQSYDSMIESLSVDQEKDRALLIITPRRDDDKQRLAESFKEKTGGMVFFIYGEDFGETSKLEGSA